MQSGSPNPVRRKWLYAGAALVALAAAAWAARPLLLGPEVKVVTVARREVVQTVVASGRVETPLRVDIGSQLTGAIAAIPVAEGQPVQARQILIELDHAEAAATAEQARAAVAQAEARLRQLRQLSLPVAQQGLRQAEVGLAQFAGHRASDMSGGQQQRVAIARALALDPPLVLADEPTGNLDTASANGVFELMRSVSATRGTGFLFVTHNIALAQRCDRIVELVDGRIAT